MCPSSELDRTPSRRRPFVRLLAAAALLAGLCGLILAVHWPWPRYFANSFAVHWDPPFHAWKLMLAARAILAGHVLPPDGNTNCFFPSSLAFYYEALHWPQALFAAGVLSFTDNPILVYHLTMLVFWAFSGVCLYALLRELRLSRTTALLGAAIFCVLPYRRLYFVEFNMQLCAGLVLCLLCGLRFFTRRGFVSGLALGMAFWFQAASELYQALIFTILSPVLFLPFLRDRSLWRDRQFWWGVGGVAVTLPLTLYFLWGYQTLHAAEGFARTLREIRQHVLEPLSYLIPPAAHRLLGIRVHSDETSFFPTLPILLLAMVYGGMMWVRRRRQEAFLRARLPVRLLRFARIAASALLAVTVFVAVRQPALLGSASTRLFNGCILGLFLSTVALGVLAPHACKARRFVSGLGAAACLAFMISLGPTVTVRASGWTVDNWVFLWTYHHIPLVSGMRVVSRFAIVVNLFVLVAAMMSWDVLSRRWGKLRWASPLLLLAVLLAYQRPVGPFERFDWAPASPAVAAARTQPGTLLFVPFGDRSFDSRSMLAIGRDDVPMLYGWGGFYPQYQEQLQTAFRVHDMPEFESLVREAWPEARLLVDKQAARTLGGRFGHQPLGALMDDLLGFAVSAVEDERYALLTLKPATRPVASWARQTRRDRLDAAPYVRLTATGLRPSQPLWLTVNGVWVAELALDAASRMFVYEVPPDLRLKVHPTRVEVRTPDGSEWLPGELAFSAQSATNGETVVERCDRLPSRWPDEVWAEPPALPDNAISTDIRFANGLRLRGVAVRDGAVHVGTNTNIRLYWSFDARATLFGQLHLFLHAKDGERTAFQSDGLVLPRTLSGDLRCQPYPKVFAQDIEMVVPPATRPGAYDWVFGLYESSGRRVAGRSALPQHHRAFAFPATLQVGERSTEPQPAVGLRHSP